MFKANKGIDSILGNQTEGKGEIKSKGTLRIDGVYEGIVEGDWIILGETARVKGEMIAREVMVGGRFEGRILAKERLEIKPKGEVFGDIKTKKLVMSEGGILEGHSVMIAEESTVLEFPQKKES